MVFVTALHTQAVQNAAGCLVFYSAMPLCDLIKSAPPAGHGSESVFPSGVVVVVVVVGGATNVYDNRPTPSLPLCWSYASPDTNCSGDTEPFIMAIVPDCEFETLCRIKTMSFGCRV